MPFSDFEYRSFLDELPPLMQQQKALGALVADFPHIDFHIREQAHADRFHFSAQTFLARVCCVETRVEDVHIHPDRAREIFNDVWTIEKRLPHGTPNRRSIEPDLKDFIQNLKSVFDVACAVMDEHIERTVSENPNTDQASQEIDLRHVKFVTHGKVGELVLDLEGACRRLECAARATLDIEKSVANFLLVRDCILDEFRECGEPLGTDAIKLIELDLAQPVYKLFATIEKEDEFVERLGAALASGNHPEVAMKPGGLRMILSFTPEQPFSQSALER